MGIIFFANYSVSMAQSVSISAGPSLPYDIYGSADFTKSAPGMAKTGYTVSVIFDDNRKGRIFSPFIQYTYNNNKIDEAAADKFYKFIDPAIKGFQAFKPWNQSIILIGPRYNYFGENFDLFVKGGIGMGWLSTFGYNVLHDSIGVIKYNILNVNALAYSVGLGTHIYVNTSVSLCLGYEYYYARANYGYEKYSDINGKTILSTVPVKVDVPLNYGNFYLGLRFLLKRNLEKK